MHMWMACPHIPNRRTPVPGVAVAVTPTTALDITAHISAGTTAADPTAGITAGDTTAEGAIEPCNPTPAGIAEAEP